MGRHNDWARGGRGEGLGDGEVGRQGPSSQGILGRFYSEFSGKLVSVPKSTTGDQYVFEKKTGGEGKRNRERENALIYQMVQLTYTPNLGQNSYPFLF